MIKINIYRKDNYITKITIQGHAEYDEYGKDLVCAGVSAVATGICNTLVEKQYLEKKECAIELKNGNIKIEVFKSDEILQVILETLVISLQTIKESYQDYIEIIDREE